jgi:hypothetical protein
MDPTPRPSPLAHRPIEWPVRRYIASLAPEPGATLGFREVLLGRRSKRHLRPASLRRIASAIALATRSQFVASGVAISRFKRPAPSAGALHPFRVCLAPLCGGPRVFLCDPDFDRLVSLQVAHPKTLLALRSRVHEMVPEGRGLLVALIGDPAITSAVYERPDSLFWRDAGALLQTLLLTCEACGLAACALGLCGDEVPAALALPSRAVAGGLVIVGCEVR